MFRLGRPPGVVSSARPRRKATKVLQRDLGQKLGSSTTLSGHCSRGSGSRSVTGKAGLNGGQAGGGALELAVAAVDADEDADVDMDAAV